MQQDVSSHPDFDQHERVEFAESDSLRAIIAVHNSTLGPAAGGCRIYPYAKFDDALKDVLRLSRGMTYKSALAGLPLGGGKSVIIADPATDKSTKMLHAMGEFIDSLQGRYIAAEDSGTSVEDIKVMADRTAHVSGYIADERFAGDPSPITAYGVFIGIREAVRHKLNTDLKGISVAVQGVGNVGYHLVCLLVEAGARVIIADPDRRKVCRLVDELGVASCSTADILSQQVEVIAPCALGGAISRASIDNLRADIIAGGANNQLEADELGHDLFERGILYAPDYVINAGGIIDIYYQQQGVRDCALVTKHVDRITGNLATIFSHSKSQNRATNLIADEMARNLFQKLDTEEEAA